MILFFGGQRYYPSGGADDLLFSADTIEDGVALFLAGPVKECDWFHAYDLAEQRIVELWNYDSESMAAMIRSSPMADDRFPSWTGHVSGYPPGSTHTYRWWHSVLVRLEPEVA